MRQFFLIFLLSIFPVFSFAAPTGYWQIMDDATGKPKSVLHIYARQNVLYGKMVKPNSGMIILSGLKQHPAHAAEWSGGQFFDPVNNKTWHCTITLLDHGRKLSVKSYLGLPLFGHTQMWKRI